MSTPKYGTLKVRPPRTRQGWALTIRLFNALFSVAVGVLSFPSAHGSGTESLALLPFASVRTGRPLGVIVMVVSIPLCLKHAWRSLASFASRARSFAVSRYGPTTRGSRPLSCAPGSV